jgi:hypothetical protein
MPRMLRHGSAAVSSPYFYVHLQALENSLKEQASFWEKKVEELDVQLQQVQQQKDQQQVNTTSTRMMHMPGSASACAGNQ